MKYKSYYLFTHTEATWFFYGCMENAMCSLCKKKKGVK